MKRQPRSRAATDEEIESYFRSERERERWRKETERKLKERTERMAAIRSFVIEEFPRVAKMYRLEEEPDYWQWMLQSSGAMLDTEDIISLLERASRVS